MIEILNKTQCTTLATYCLRADGFTKRLRGLLFRPLWQSFDALYLTPCRSIHTIGLSHAIDVIYIDQNHRIVKWMTIKPGRWSIGPQAACAVIELPAGTCQARSCAVNDQLLLLENQKGK